MLRAICATIVAAFMLPAAAGAATPGTSASPTGYKVTVTKVELCRTSACSSPFVIGSVTRDFDIASATAGSDVGSYISLSGIPLYQTWSYVRVTLDPAFVITASGNDDQGTACNTDSTDASSGHTALGIATAVAASAQTLYVPDYNAFAAGVPSQAADFTPKNLDKTAGGNLTVLYPLTSPYTCKGTMPKIEVKFDTSNSVNFYDINGAGAGGQCRAYPMPPTVTITVTD
jgi:hypothetical protein